MRRLVLSLACVAVLAACSAELPEPDSSGARIYTARCGGCHRLYAPSLMTPAMWKVQVDRMRLLFRQRGIPWPAPDEERTLLAYLERHAGTQ